MWIFLAAVGVALLLARSSSAVETVRVLPGDGAPPPKRLGATAGATATAIAPPEYPTHASDMGVMGDLAQMSANEQRMVTEALFEENISEKLFSLADDVEETGYPIAANRLRQKAMRLIAS